MQLLVLPLYGGLPYPEQVRPSHQQSVIATMVRHVHVHVAEGVSQNSS